MTNDRIAVEFTGDSTQLQAEISKASLQMKELKKTLIDVSNTKGIDSKEWKAAFDQIAATNKKLIETAQAAGDIAKINTQARTLKSILVEIEKTKGIGSEQWKQAKLLLTETEKAAADLGKEMKQMNLGSMTMQQLENHAKSLAKEMKNADRNTQEYTQNGKRLGAVEQAMRQAKEQAENLKKAGQDLAQPSLWQKISSGVNTVGGAFKGIMALQIIGYIIEIGKAVFDATAKMEKYEKVLTTAFGGNEKVAKESMEAIKKMAKDTIFTVDELTEGYVKMINRGMKPSQVEMKAMADLAASQGKTFDQLVEAALDAQTGEMERLKEFGIRASKSGDQVTLSFKGVNQTVKNTPDAIQGAIVKFGEMNGVAGQNSKMMETLNGKTSNLQDDFFALAAEVGDNLRPVFIALMEVVQKLIPYISLVGKVTASVVLVAKGVIVGFVDFLTNSFQVFRNLGDAALQLMKGNVEGAKKAADAAGEYSKKVFTSMKDGVKKGVTEAVSIWQKGAADAKLAGKDTGANFEGALTAEQKKAIKEREAASKKAREQEKKDIEKHLEDIKKANEDALKKLDELENEAFVETVKRNKGELEAERVLLQQKLDAQLDEVNKSLASQENKEKLSKYYTEKYLRDLAAINDKARKEQEKEDEKAATAKIKLSEKRLSVEKQVLEQEGKAEKALLDWKEIAAKGNTKKLLEIDKERLDKQLLQLKKQLQLEEQAEELKIIKDIKDEKELEEALAKLHDAYRKREVEEEKKTAEAKTAIDKKFLEDKKKRQVAAGNAFAALLKFDLVTFTSHLDEMAKGEKNGFQKSIEGNMQKFEAIAKIATAAVDFLNKLAQKRAEKAIAEAQRERDKQVAILQASLDKETAALEEVEAKKAAIKEAYSDKVKSIKEIEEAKIKGLEDHYRQLTSVDNKKALDAKLASYKENADEQKQVIKDAAEATIQAAKDTADNSIKEAKKAKDEAIANARDAKAERVISAEATRDAEIASIQASSAFDKATKDRLIAESKAKAETEKNLAQQEYDLKVNLAKSEADTKIAEATKTADITKRLAEEQKDAELKAIEAVQRGDEAAAKEILARAKESAKEQIRLAEDEADKKIKEAETEKDEKLKLVAEEKAKRVQEKKDLEAKIVEEDKKSKRLQYEANLKAWKAQQKADIATALINGALATIKALASGFFPVNLVFAALTAVATGIQVAMIKKQSPPDAPSFRTGGLINGAKHGSSYGKGGIALVERDSNMEVGEMEGGEYIVPADQTAMHLPLLNEFSRRSIAGEKKPLGLGMAFKHGGFMSYPFWSKPMYQYGGTVEESSGDGGTAAETANSEAAHKEAKEQGNKQLKLLEEIRDEVKSMSEDVVQELNKISVNTRNEVQATKAVEQAVRDNNQGGKFDNLIASISRLGRAA